jgi:hypothetical protein
MTLLLDTLTFKEGSYNNRHDSYVAIDVNNKYIIKIEVSRNERKRNSIDKEYFFIKKLNDLGCKTCPIVYEFGSSHRF